MGSERGDWADGQCYLCVSCPLIGHGLRTFRAWAYLSVVAFWRRGVLAFVSRIGLVIGSMNAFNLRAG